MFENLQGFFESALGQAAVILIIAVFFLLIVIPTGKQKGQKADPKALTISALLIALAVGLGQLKLFEMPYGAQLLFSPCCLSLCAATFSVLAEVLSPACAWGF